MGITKQANVNNDSWCAYASGPVLAATWNTSLAYAMGQAVGQEALTTGVTGWYAPGLNIHRSAFSGRNFEYYSEDPLLTGTIGAEVVSGAGDQGLICNLKHFAMNDQETNRVGLLTWATEQTMREISMRGFEICVKTAKKSVTYIADDKGTTKTVVMPATSEVLTAACYIGPTWCSNNYSLVTKVLRGEWGFEGFVTTDMSFILPSCDAGLDMLFRSGVDNHMCTTNLSSLKDKSSAVTQWTLRRAIKNISFSIANSNALQGVAPGSTISYRFPSWRYIQMIANALTAALIVWIIWLNIRRTKDERRSPENYRPYISRREKRKMKKIQE